MTQHQTVELPTVRSKYLHLIRLEADLLSCSMRALDSSGDAGAWMPSIFFFLRKAVSAWKARDFPNTRALMINVAALCLLSLDHLDQFGFHQENEDV